jgi:hypothetical protein
MCDQESIHRTEFLGYHSFDRILNHTTPKFFRTKQTRIPQHSSHSRTAAGMNKAAVLLLWFCIHSNVRKMLIWSRVVLERNQVLILVKLLVTSQPTAYSFQTNGATFEVTTFRQTFRQTFRRFQTISDKLSNKWRQL